MMCLTASGVETTLQVAEEEAGEVSVHTLITADKFVQTR